MPERNWPLHQRSPYATPCRVILDAAYLLAGGVTAMVALLVWVTGVSVVLTLSVVIVGIPVADASRAVADLDRRNAALALGVPFDAIYRDRYGLEVPAQVLAVVLDRQTWRDLQWLVSHSVTGSAFAFAAGTLISSVVGLITLPAWSWALHHGADYFGLGHVDTLPTALATASLAIPHGILSVILLRIMATVEAQLAVTLLGPGQSQKNL